MSEQSLVSLNYSDYIVENKPRFKGYKPSGGGNYQARGSQDLGKTMWLVLMAKYLVTKGGYSALDGIGNLHLTGEWANGFTTLKGENLHQYLWDMTHKPYRHKWVIIDEIDSEFPARFFSSREQTEIALRMWHNFKLRNYFLYSSHLGRGSDLIWDLATNFEVLPHGVNWQHDCLEFTLINGMDLTIDDWIVSGCSEVANEYDRWEMTEDTEEDNNKIRPSLLLPKKPKFNKKLTQFENDFSIDEELEIIRTP